MNMNQPDSSFDTEGSAREHAAEISKSNNSPWYIILTGGLYFITNTKSLQTYEQLVACYVCGQNQPLKQRSY